MKLRTSMLTLIFAVSTAGLLLAQQPVTANSGDLSGFQTQDHTTTASTEMGTNQVSQSQVLQNINNALHKDTKLANSDIKVSSENNRIVLTGNVADRGAKQRAEQVASWYAPKELEIVNQIAVGR
jgi:osmotically-inducible protein OsmY